MGRIQLRRGARCKVWDGHTGTVRYFTTDGWIGVQLDGEAACHEWQRFQVEVVS